MKRFLKRIALMMGCYVGLFYISLMLGHGVATFNMIERSKPDLATRFFSGIANILEYPCLKFGMSSTMRLPLILVNALIWALVIYLIAMAIGRMVTVHSRRNAGDFNSN